MPVTTQYSVAEETDLLTRMLSPRFRDNPEAFVMFAFPWGQPDTPLAKHKGPRKWQRAILREMTDAIEANNDPKVREAEAYNVFRKAISSGRGIGKSALISWVALWAVSTHIGMSVLISANTESQLFSVTWAELLKWHSMLKNAHWWEATATRLTPAPWLAELVERDLKISTRYWNVAGKLWRLENPGAFAGAHNEVGMMVIFDECAGIPPAIWDVAQGFFTERNPNRYWLAFSNPRSNDGYFYNCFHGTQRDFWSTSIVNAYDVEGTDKTVYDQIIAEYGADSMQARVEIYGLPPADDDRMFISPNLVDDAMARTPWDEPSAPIIIGVDPARMGSDATAIVVRQGRDILSIDRHRKLDTMEVVGLVIHAIEEWKPDLVVVDQGGIGAGIFDRLREQKFRQVKGVDFGWSPRNPRAWFNKRAEMWGDLREWLRTASIPNDRLLKSDLCAPGVKFASTGAIQLESKQEIKARGGASPDSADAIAMTFAHACGPRNPDKFAPKRKGVGGWFNPSLGNTGWMGS